MMSWVLCLVTRQEARLASTDESTRQVGVMAHVSSDETRSKSCVWSPDANVSKSANKRKRVKRERVRGKGQKGGSEAVGG